MHTDELNAPPRRLRRVVAGLAKLAVSAALLTLLARHTDLRELWATVRTASVPWLAAGLAIYTLIIIVSTWRWRLLLHAQRIAVSSRRLFGIYLVAQFFNNFLPSNIGGDVFRIADTARPAGSTTRAATVVLTDRILGVTGLTFVAACGATATKHFGDNPTIHSLPLWLWAGFLCVLAAVVIAVVAPRLIARLLQPLTIFHAEWIGKRIAEVTEALSRFRARPQALLGCFCGAVTVQLLFIAFYVTVAHALDVAIGPWDLAVIVPLSLVLQMLPVSINGFGVREATFSFFFVQLGLPIAAALAVSLVGTGLIMFFSLSGAVTYALRPGAAPAASRGELSRGEAEGAELI
jgi:uncharacterized protein (TIRG00374 family)